MDCKRHSNFNGRDDDVRDDMSHDNHSDDEMHDCDSIENSHITVVRSHSIASNGANTNIDIHGYNRTNDIVLNPHHSFPPSHPINTLGSAMGIGNLHSIPNLQHNDVLEKLKMQVRDIKLGLMEQEYATTHTTGFGSNIIPINTAFTLTSTTMASYTNAPNSLTSQAGSLNNNSLLSRTTLSNACHNTFSFTSPAPSTKEANPASSSSTSSETSNSSQQNSWSFEEQYKQVRQLYEINDDPKRKEFLDDLFSFMQKRGTPINRLPIMAKSVLDLYELYNLVIARGGLVDVINKKLWQEIIKGLHLPSSITSAAFTLRTQYMKYLYPYECEKNNLSSPAELQAAIDGNRREGRRSSYGQYETMHSQVQMPQINRQSIPSGLQQMSPLALVTHAANNQQAQAAAAAVAAHQRLMAPSFGQVQNVVTQEIEQRMIEYLKLIQVKKEQNDIGSGTMGLSLQQQHRPRSQSPEITPRDALNALEMSRAALWQIYHNNTSPPAPVNISPQSGGNINCGTDIEYANKSQRNDVLNISESGINFNTIKREREREPSLGAIEHSDFLHQPPPSKRTGFPATFYRPSGITDVTVATPLVNCNYKDDDEVSDNEADNDKHNTSANSSRGDLNAHNHISNSSMIEVNHHGGTTSVSNDKSDDSAIENSPTTSAASAGNGQVSPVSTKKHHLTNPLYVKNNTPNTFDPKCTDNIQLRNSSSLGQFEVLTMLSSMQLRVTRNGTNANGQQQLVVNLEIDDVKYSGVLMANTSKEFSAMKTAEATTSTKTETKTYDNSLSSQCNNHSHNEKNITQRHYDGRSLNNSPKSNEKEKIKVLAVSMEDVNDAEKSRSNPTAAISNDDGGESDPHNCKDSMMS